MASVEAGHPFNQWAVHPRSHHPVQLGHAIPLHRGFCGGTRGPAPASGQPSVVPASKLVEEADHFIRTKILPNAPLAMRIMKEVAVKERNMTFPDQVRFAGAARARAEAGEDFKEGIVAFLERGNQSLKAS